MKPEKIQAEEIDQEQQDFYADQYDDYSGAYSEITTDEIKTYIKNQDQFCWLFGVEMNYYLPPKTLITWPYIIMVLSGQKKLLKNNQVTIGHDVPRIKELKMDIVWGQYKSDKLLFSYMPVTKETQYPPRNYFFRIFATLYPDKFREVLNKAQKERRLKMVNQNKVIRVTSNLLNEIQGARIWTELSSKKKSKRILTKSKKIRKPK